MGDPDLLTITGVTPEQEAILREIVAWPGVPSMARQIHANFGPGWGNQAGATGFSMDNRFVPQVDYIGGPMLHEYGHTWEKQWLSIEDRQKLIDDNDMPYGWYGGEYMVRPVERFAATFAKIAMATEGHIVGSAFADIPSMLTTRPDQWFTKEETMLTVHPDAIQRTPCKGTRPGKPWSGGSGKPKLLLHTIEGADDDIGWPRDWTRWCATPHLALHPWKYGEGKANALYQLVPFDRAAYSLRDNDGEDDRFVYQVELAGRAVNVPFYSDDWYRGVAQLCQWFIDNMGVADIFHDFENPYRMGSEAMNAFSGILGHVHFGRGIDTHTDPGRLDVTHLRTFMSDGAPAPRTEGELMPRILFERQIDALFAAKGEFKPAPGHTIEEGAQYWKDLIDDPTNPEWADFFAAFTRMVS